MLFFRRLFPRKPARAVTPKPPTLGPLADLMRGIPDDAGYVIIDIYARKPPDYAVFSNEQRVAIQFADRADKAAEQRKMMSGLNPLRGEINGLIDGWRYAGEHSGRRRKAQRYDRRVADSLIAALEGDVAGGIGLLTRIKQDIVDERTANARLLYVAAALGMGGAAVAVIALFRTVVPLPEVAGDLFAASVAGAFGAFFSIALAMRNRTVLLDLLWLANMLDALLRMVIGLVAAAVLMAMVDARLVNVSFGDLQSSPANARVSQQLPAAAQANQPQAAQPQAAGAPADATPLDRTAVAGKAPIPGGTWLQILLIGFIAGFSERFVPDLLAKATVTAMPPVPPAAPGERQAARDRDKPEMDTPGQDDEADHGGTEDPEARAEEAPGGPGLSDDEATPDTSLPAASGGVGPLAPATPG